MRKLINRQQMKGFAKARIAKQARDWLRTALTSIGDRTRGSSDDCR
jgi:hypothetical protein